MKKSAAHENWLRTGALFGLAFVTMVVGCTSEAAATKRANWPRPTYYTVIAHPGDTVRAVGARYGVSPLLLARLNGLSSVDRIPSGQVVIIPALSRRTRESVLSEALNHAARNYATPPKSLVVGHPFPPFERPVKVSTTAPHLLYESQARHAQQQNALRFSWPIAGTVISSFGPGEYGARNEGINIAAELGAPFRAAADGTVSYAGPLRGYGNLILITHARGYVTAYAHAENVSVASGEKVGKGQVIGTAGDSGGVSRPQLHFEIRRGVKPIDPSLLLAANS